MRDVKPALTAAWLSGDYVGKNRPAARVTVQQAGITLHDVGYNLYSTLPFGRPNTKLIRDYQLRNAPNQILTRQQQFGTTQRPSFNISAARYDGVPRELPNLTKVSWQRDADAEIASATLTFLNCEPLPPGVVAYQDYEQPGYFTYNRGNSVYSVRWSQKPNEWAGLLVPDNILRTYEGYGFDPTVYPDDDPHLEQTGVWMIDKVEYGANGLITVTCRDIGRILSDQLLFPPVVPKGYYPTSLTTTKKAPGFVAGKTYTKVVTSGGDHDPKHPPPDGWTGPTAAPSFAFVSNGDSSAVVRITPSRVVQTGYAIAGYQLRVDNVLLPTIITGPLTSGQTSGQGGLALPHIDVTVPNLINGNVYLVNAVAVYEDTAKGRTHLSDDSVDLFVRPADPAAPQVVTGSLLTNTDKDGNQNKGETHPGQLVWHYTANGRPTVFTIIFYKTVYQRLDDPRLFTDLEHGKPTRPSIKRLRRYSFQLDLDAAAAGSDQVVEWMSPTDVHPIEDWNILVHGADGDVPAPPGVAVLRRTPQIGDPLRVGAGECFFRSAGGEFYAPPTPGAPPQQTFVVPGPELPVRLAYDTSSNDYYDGTTDRSFYGHNPRDGFDGNPATYFLSVGNESPSRGFAFEWLQGACNGQTLTGVTFSTVKAGYTAYISVFARGAWVQFHAGDIIGYNAKLPQSHNGGNIPFCATAAVPSEAPVTVHFAQPIPGATKVRVSLHGLQNFGLGSYPYRGAIREMSALSDGSVTVSGPAVDVDDPVVVQTYTVTEPPYVQPGLGQIPQEYYDYTDIVKVFCAWAGFFWPKHASIIKCNGKLQGFGFGPGPYGLPDVDPVLGTDAGRVWGDFENTGTAGIVDLTQELWDKKTILDGIVYLREIVGFLFYIDEYGSVVWKHRNIYQVGNDVADLSQQPRRTEEIPTLDETRELMQLNVTLDSRNTRERVFIAASDGSSAGLSSGFNPNPIGLRRVGGWTDQNFVSTAECQRMADFIVLRQMFTYRSNTVTIAGYPKIQVNDQVRLFERVTAESYIHYVAGISSTNDLAAGEWTYQLTTQWLGENPGSLWIFHTEDLSKDTRDFLAALGILRTDIDPLHNTGTTTTTTTVKPTPESTDPGSDPDMAVLIKSADHNNIYISNGVHKRYITTPAELTALVNAGLCGATVRVVPQAVIDGLCTAYSDAELAAQRLKSQLE